MDLHKVQESERQEILDLTVVILAAGKGRRMKSARPKVLQPLAGRPLLDHVIAAARALAPSAIIVVYGEGADQVRAQITGDDLVWVHQECQLGTGHAVQLALSHVAGLHQVLILYGDVPGVRPRTLAQLVDSAADGSLAVLTVRLSDPTGYGRIVRDHQNQICAIVEENDISPEQRSITEINTGLMAGPVQSFRAWLDRLDPDNAQGEYYLTDIVGHAIAEGFHVKTVMAESEAEVMGINDRLQLAAAEKAYRKKMATALMKNGVTLADPDRIDVRGELSCGRDVYIDVNVIFEGKVEIGDNVRIGPNTVIRDSVIGAGTQIHPNCVIEQAVMAADCEVGPYARLRPGVELSERAKLGNFVELKKSTVGRGSKVNHLSYVGDTSIGADVNVGAGTITCNSDGDNKYRTIIGDREFIGSGVQLVAPVEVGEGATIGAGTTVSKPAPAEELTVGRVRQTVVRGWKRPTKGGKG